MFQKISSGSVSSRNRKRLILKGMMLATFGMLPLLLPQNTLGQEKIWNSENGTSWTTSNGNAWSATGIPGVGNWISFTGSLVGGANHQINGNQLTSGLLSTQTITYSFSVNRTVGSNTGSGQTAPILQLNGPSGSNPNTHLINVTNSGNFTIRPRDTSTGPNLSLRLGNSGSFNIGSSGNLIVESNITEIGGPRRLTISGTGTGRVDLTNSTNSFTGGITITGSEVRLSADGSSGSAPINARSDYFVIDGGRLATANNASFTLNSNRGIQIGDSAGTSISAVGNATLTYNGIISDVTGKTGSWAKQGTGSLALGGVSTYTGSTAINNGTLRLTTGDNRLPTGTVVSLGQAASTNLGTLDLNGRNQTIAGLQSISGTNTGVSTNVVTSTTSAVLTINNTSDFVFSSGTAANSGNITGAISLVKNGIGTQTLGGANSYTGSTTVNAGTLAITTADSLGGSSGAVTVTGGTLNLGGFGVTKGAVEVSGGTISNGTLTGASYALTNAGTVNASLAGVGVSLTKSGVGTATLSGANSYTGTTTINAGTLLVNGTHTGGGTYTVNANGTLGGSGVITADVNLVGGTLSAGNSIGTMTVNGDLTFDSSSKLFVEFNSSNLSADILNVVSGTVNLGGAFLDLNDLASAVTPIGSSFTFLTAASVNGRFSNFADGAVTNIGSNQWKISYGNGSISFASVPEPSSLALIGLLGLSGFTYRRFRSKKKKLPEVVA